MEAEYQQRVDETNVDPEPEIFILNKRREWREVLVHIFNYEGMMRFPEDEFEGEGKEVG